jgi:IS5 family transposase
MIIERYERPAGIVAPPVSDPILGEMDGLLDDAELWRLMRKDLQPHYSRSQSGRPSIPVEVILRMTVLRRRKRWSYRQAEQEVRDSPAYRWWVRVYDHPVPDHTTLNDLERLIQPQTLYRLNDRLLVLAQDYRMTQGYKLRVDSSVTESNVHYPTDSSLLVDGVRVLSRLLQRAEPFLPAALRRAGVCSNHTRSARRRARVIGRLSQSVSAASAASRTAGAKKRRENKPIGN